MLLEVSDRRAVRRGQTVVGFRDQAVHVTHVEWRNGGLGECELCLRFVESELVLCVFQGVFADADPLFPQDASQEWFVSMEDKKGFFVQLLFS